MKFYIIKIFSGRKKWNNWIINILFKNNFIYLNINKYNIDISSIY